MEFLYGYVNRTNQVRISNTVEQICAFIMEYRLNNVLITNPLTDLTFIETSMGMIMSCSDQEYLKNTLLPALVPMQRNEVEAPEFVPYYKLDITKTLTVSIVHIKRETASYLEKEDHEELIVYTKGEYGWFIYIGSEYLEEELEYAPEDLVQVIRFAQKQDCQWLVLDCDGEEVHELPTYEW